VLRFESKTIGSIASLIGIDPGAEYNMDPFVAIIEPQVSAYNHHDIVLTVNSATATGRFIAKEQIQQALDSVGRQITVVSFSGVTANGTVTDTPFIGERVYQKYPNNAIRADGIVSEGLLSGGAGSFKLKTFSGVFVNTSNNSTKLYSQTSNATANVTAVSNVTITSNARGIVQDTSNTTVLHIKRITLENTFVEGKTIVGRTSGATANVTVVDENRTTEVIGLNANVSANVQTALGVVTDLSVQDSGFGYVDQELVTLTSKDSIYQVTAVALLEKQGVGSGYYASTGSFLDADKKLHDNDYYQEYSYEVETKVPFDMYVDVLKTITHVAGTKIFGAVESISQATMPLSVIVGDTINKIEIS
jgi:hypothetical protein